MQSSKSVATAGDCLGLDGFAAHLTQARPLPGGDALESDLLLIAVNLAEAVLADAYALDVLTSIHRRAAAASKVFLVVAPDPQAHETMRVTGLDQSLLVFPTVADFNAWNGDPGTQ